MSLLLKNTENKRLAVITDNNRQYTYGQMCDIVNGFRDFLNKRALGFIFCKNVFASLAGYVAFIENNVPALLIDANKDLNSLRTLLEIYKPKYLWLPNELVGEFTGSIVYTLENYSLLITDAPEYPIHEDVALLLTTSGSTGSPKLVKLTRGNIVSNAEAIASYLNIDKDERPITSLPMYYSYGLSVINSHLIKGATILLTDESVLQRRFWDFLKEHRATSISGVPYTYEMLKRLRLLKMDIPSLKTLTQAGGKLRPELVKEFVELSKSSGKRFIVMYGQTEATARMSYTPEEHALDKYKSIGIAIPGGKFMLMDDKGNEINDPDVDGELIYAGPNVSMGYAECIEDLGKDDENNGILHTGDIARKDKDGYYYITGRKKRFVKVWGNRCNLDSTEQIVRELTPDCACVGEDDLITVFITTPGLEHEIKKLLVERTGLNTRAFDIRTIDSIPKNSSGKTQYAELQKLI